MPHWLSESSVKLSPIRGLIFLDLTSYLPWFNAEKRVQKTEETNGTDTQTDFGAYPTDRTIVDKIRQI
jgi:hypothetical protein